MIVEAEEQGRARDVESTPPMSASREKSRQKVQAKVISKASDLLVKKAASVAVPSPDPAPARAPATPSPSKRKTNAQAVSVHDEESETLEEMKAKIKELETKLKRRRQSNAQAQRVYRVNFILIVLDIVMDILCDIPHDVVFAGQAQSKCTGSETEDLHESYWIQCFTCSEASTTPFYTCNLFVRLGLDNNHTSLHAVNCTASNSYLGYCWFIWWKIRRVAGNGSGRNETVDAENEDRSQQDKETSQKINDVRG